MISTNLGTEKDKIIFVTGFPRSGTTWFSNLFNSHPDVVYRHEFIGRCYEKIPEKLFSSLKNDNGLTDSAYQELIDIIAAANPEADRPPFFTKNYLGKISNKLHYYLWLATQVIPFVSPIYRYFYQPRTENRLIIIKENRASTNMDSMIRGLRTNQNIFLFRHPCGCVASVLNGIKSGKMTPSLVSDRKGRFKDNRQNGYIVSNNITEKAFLEMPEYEYQALLWRLQNDDYIDLSQQFTNSVFVNYENFLTDTGGNTKKLFHILGLSYSDSVNSFLHESSASDAKQLTIIKDSKSYFYSVFRGSGFNPEKWKKDLTGDQIKSIEQHSLDIYEKMLSLDICKKKI